MVGNLLGKSTNQAPISRHPAFPAIVALWFAALFGIGSLILPAILFDKLAGLFGMTSFGITGRIAIAALAAAAGVALGLFLARKVTAAHAGTPRAPHRRPAREEQVKKPILAHEELGSEGLDEPIEDEEEPVRAEPIPGRKRALSVTDDSGPSEYLDNVPLPAGDEPLEIMEREFSGKEDTLELGDFEDGETSEPEEPARDTGTFGTGALSLANGDHAGAPQRSSILRQTEPQPDTERPFAPPLSDSSGQQRPFDAPAPIAATQDDADMQEEPVEADNFTQQPEDDSPFSQLQHQHSAPESDAPETSSIEAQGTPVNLPFGMPQPVTEPTGPEASADTLAERETDFAPEPDYRDVETDPAPGAASDTAAAEGVAQSPLAELGMVELVERFALSLQRHTGAAEQTHAAPADQPFAVPEPVEPAEAPAEAAPAAIDEPAQALPTALRPFAANELDQDGEDEHDDSDLDLDLDQAASANPFAAPADNTPAAGDAADDNEAESFGSLLSMKSPPASGRDFVRIEEEEDEAHEDDIEPVVVFPGNEDRRAAPASDGPSRDPGDPAGTAFAPRPADPDSTEQALREALAKLQKLSGAA